MKDKHIVSERAVVARINRRLREDGEVLHKARSWHTHQANWYVVNENNLLTSWFDDLDKWARYEVPVLKDWESIAGY